MSIPIFAHAVSTLVQQIEGGRVKTYREEGTQLLEVTGLVFGSAPHIFL
jgi:alkylated DNA nucleotide flippase Atl1